MDNHWQTSKCGSMWQSSTEQAVGVAPAPVIQVPSQESSRNPTNNARHHHSYPNIVQEPCSSIRKMMNGPLFQPTNFNLYNSVMGNSFFTLLSGPPPFSQYDSQQLLSSKPSNPSSKVHVHNSTTVVGPTEREAPFGSSELSSQNIDNSYLKSKADTCPVVPVRNLTNNGGNTNTASCLHDIVKAASVSGQNPAPHGKLQNSSVTHKQSPCGNGLPRVFCLYASGDLFLSNSGLLGVVCSCHGFTMSISKFSEHSGLQDVNPGDAVHMDSGETIAQWRKTYFCKFGIRIPEDQCGWNWPEGFSTAADSIRTNQRVPNVSRSSHLSNSAAPSKTFAASKQPSLNNIVFPNNHQPNQNLVNEKPQSKSQNRAVKITDPTLSRCLPTSKLTGGNCNAFQSGPTYVNPIYKTKSSFTSQKIPPNIGNLDKDSDKFSGSRDGDKLEKVTISSNIELRLGQPSEQSQTLGRLNVLGFNAPSRVSRVGNPLELISSKSQVYNVGSNKITDESKQSVNCAAEAAKSSLIEGQNRNLGFAAYTTRMPEQLKRDIIAVNSRPVLEIPKDKTQIKDSHMPKQQYVESQISKLDSVNFGCTDNSTKVKSNFRDIGNSCGFSKDQNTLGNSSNGNVKSSITLQGKSNEIRDEHKLLSKYNLQKLATKSIHSGTTSGTGGGVADKSAVISVSRETSFQIREIGTQRYLLSESYQTSPPLPRIGISENIFSSSVHGNCCQGTSCTYVPDKCNHWVQKNSMKHNSNLEGKDLVGVFRDPPASNMEKSFTLHEKPISPQKIRETTKPNSKKVEFNAFQWKDVPTKMSERCHEPYKDQKSKFLEHRIEVNGQTSTFFDQTVGRVDRMKEQVMSYKDQKSKFLEHKIEVNGETSKFFDQTVERVDCMKEQVMSHKDQKSKFLDHRIAVNNQTSIFFDQTDERVDCMKEQVMSYKDQKSKFLDHRIEVNGQTSKFFDQTLERVDHIKEQVMSYKDQKSKYLEHRIEADGQISKCFDQTVEKVDLLKEQVMSNISSKCSAPALTQTSVRISNGDSCTDDAQNSTKNFAVDESSGIQKSCSSDNAPDSGSNSGFDNNINSKNEKNRSTRSLIDELRVIDSLRLKKVDYHDNTSSMKKTFEKDSISKKRKRENKFKILSSPVSSVSTGSSGQSSGSLERSGKYICSVGHLSKMGSTECIEIPETSSRKKEKLDLGCSKRNVRKEDKDCKRITKPVVCGRYGVISNGDTSKPAKIFSLVKILESSRKFDSSRTEISKKPTKKGAKKLNSSFREDKVLSSEDDFMETSEETEMEDSSPWEKDSATSESSSETSSSSSSSSYRYERKQCMSDNDLGTRKRRKSKEVRKRSLYELISQGKDSEFATISKNKDSVPQDNLKNNELSNNLHVVDNINRFPEELTCKSTPDVHTFCHVCGSLNNDEINCLLECKRCLIKVHQACYGISKVPKSHWYCRPCKENATNMACVLCGYEGGVMTRANQSSNIVKSLLKAWNVITEDMHAHVNNASSSVVLNSVTSGFFDPTVKQWVHMVCGLWTPGTRCPNVDTMSAFDVSGASFPKGNVVCSMCKRSGGCCIRCRVVDCAVHFHPWCAHQKGLLQSEVEGAENDMVGFYGRCELHATKDHYTPKNKSNSQSMQVVNLDEKETCARTEGYKGRKREGFRHDGEESSGGSLVRQEQVDAWNYINRQLLFKKRIQRMPQPIQDVEYDSRKEYARYKQSKGWKHLVVYKSGIHALGLYTSLFIPQNAMVVEYVGEIVGLRVADKRENQYQSGKQLQYKSACYFFRIDKEHIIDATRKGGIARFVNHSCQPNCVAKVITMRGEKKVVFLAERDIYPGEEITYDYHFNNEDEAKKILCSCNSNNCRRYLN